MKNNRKYGFHPTKEFLLPLQPKSVMALQKDMHKNQQIKDACIGNTQILVVE